MTYGERAVLCLMGPTAVGKTDVAVELVKRFPLDIVSVDSAMVYRRMNIGTGKPDPDTLARAPHRLIDIREPYEGYSAASFAADALNEINAIHAEGRFPLLVGGTGLYFRALREGLAELPSANPGLRRSYVEEAERHGWDALHARLAAVDAQAAARIHPNDPQRIQRALEVCQLSGTTLSDLLRAGREARLPNPSFALVIEPGERNWLHERIAMRFGRMLTAGFETEVRTLLDEPEVHPDLPAMRSVGYRQMVRYLNEDWDRDEMVRRAVYATRQLAKRQLTWLRSEAACERTVFFPHPGGFERVVACAIAWVRSHLS